MGGRTVADVTSVSRGQRRVALWRLSCDPQSALPDRISVSLRFSSSQRPAYQISQRKPRRLRQGLWSGDSCNLFLPSPVVALSILATTYAFG